MYDRRLMMLLATLGATAGVATYAATADAAAVGRAKDMAPRLARIWQVPDVHGRPRTYG